MRRRGFTAVELVLVIVVGAIVVSVALWQVDKRRQARLRAESAASLQTLYRALSGQMSNSPPPRGVGGAARVWPLFSPFPGQLVPDIGHVLTQDLLNSKNQSALISPAHPDAERMRREAQTDPESSFTDASYWYLGYVLPNEEAGLALVEAYKKAVEETGSPPSVDFLEVKPYDPGDGTKIDRLPRLPITRRVNHANTPVMVERPGLQRGGSNVLFADGHVEFIPYPGKWPMTEKFIKALESLDELKVNE